MACGRLVTACAAANSTQYLSLCPVVAFPFRGVALLVCLLHDHAIESVRFPRSCADLTLLLFHGGLTVAASFELKRCENPDFGLSFRLRLPLSEVMGLTSRCVSEYRAIKAAVTIWVRSICPPLRALIFFFLSHRSIKSESISPAVICCFSSRMGSSCWGTVARSHAP